MKKVVVIAAVFLLMVVFSVEAKMMRGGGKFVNYTSVNLESLKKFHKDTLELRDELFIKRVELEKEYAKERKDYEKITALKKDIVSLQTKIQALGEKYGIKSNKIKNCYNCDNCYLGQERAYVKCNKRCW